MFFKLMTAKPHDRLKERLAVVLRDLIDQRGLRQKVIAQRIGITESSLSHILNGRARPRQITLTRLMQQISVTPDEEQRIVAAYDHAEFRGLPERSAIPERPMPEDELERVRRYMEVKTLSVAFEEEVAKRLRNGDLAFQRSYSRDSYICDFFLAGPPSIAIDCKFNINRDWDRAVATVKLLAKHLPADRVLIVVPGENSASRAAGSEMAACNGTITTAVDLVATVRSILEGRTDV